MKFFQFTVGYTLLNKQNLGFRGTLPISNNNNTHEQDTQLQIKSKRSYRKKIHYCFPNKTLNYEDHQYI